MYLLQHGNLFDMDKEIQNIIEQELGLTKITPIHEGGQSYSYKSYDPILNRNVFMKVYWYSDKHKDTLLIEPRRLSTLFNSNPNSRKHIANVYDVSKFIVNAEEHLFIKMEYCGNENLGQIIKSRPISIHEAIDYSKQLCEGLHFLHSVSILHRDIKPENLMIDSGLCKLVDFGSTTNLGENECYIRGTSMKTKNYTPPEYFQQDKIYGKFSDVYQIGVVLHEMLNGKINIDYSKLPRGFIKRYETQFSKNLDSFSDWDISELENGIINYYSSKNNFLSVFSEVQPHIPRKLIETIKTITNSNFSKRPNSCVMLRNLLSNLVVPNWLKISDIEYSISNWKGKDYKIFHNAQKSEWILESATYNSTNFRKNASLKTRESIFKFING